MSELTASQPVAPLPLGEVIVQSWQAGWKAWPWLLPLGGVWNANLALSGYWLAAGSGAAADFPGALYFGFLTSLAIFPSAVFLTNVTLKRALGESIRFKALWQGWGTISLLILLLVLVFGAFVLLLSAIPGWSELAQKPWVNSAFFLIVEGGGMALFGLSTYCAAHQKRGVWQSLRQALALGQGERGSLMILGILAMAYFPTEMLQGLGTVRFVGEFVWGTLFFPFQVMLFAIVYRQRIQASEGESA